MRTILFAITVLFSLHAKAQCDPSFMFETIVWPKAPFALLKPYAIPVREIKGAPFSIQYSYLLERASTYGFYVKPIGTGVPPVKFSLTNNNNEVMKCDTLENFGRDGFVLGFTPTESDAYNLNLYSANSFNGCLVFYVSVDRPIEKTKDGWKITMPNPIEAVVRKALGKDSILRRFDMRYNSSARYAVRLEEGQLYALQIPDDQSAKILSVHVGSGHTDATINTHIVPREKGYVFYIRSSESGVHAFDFLNSSKDKPAVALLMLSKEVVGLPK